MPAGYVVGKTLRFVEWDLEASPGEADGAMKRVAVRTNQLTLSGLRIAVAKAYGLESGKSVKQFAQTTLWNTKVFYERLENRAAIAALDDGAVIVWTSVRASPSHACMPHQSVVGQCIVGHAQSPAPMSGPART
jgi:hypothetical protein